MYFYLQYIIYIYMYIWYNNQKNIYRNSRNRLRKKKTEEESDKSVVNCKLKTECELWGEWNLVKPCTAY